MSIPVSWSGDDGNGSGVVAYTVQVQDNGGSWQDWLVGTQQTGAEYQGQPEHTYHFRVKARDRVGHETAQWVVFGPVVVKAVTKYYTLGSQRVAMRQGSQVYYLHGDHLGSTSLTTDQAGQPVFQARYLPYGEEQWREGRSRTDFGFTGQRREVGFGLYDYNARFYSPYLGRFVSPDTIVPGGENPQAWNRYAYTLNNPLGYTDPSGHECVPANGQNSCQEIFSTGGVTIQGTTTIPQERETVQPVIDIVNRGSNAVAWPAAVAGQTTQSVHGGLGALGNGQIINSWNNPPTVGLLPSSTLREIPTVWNRASAVGSYALPAVGGVLNARETQLRLDAGEITNGQAVTEQVANAGFTGVLMYGGGSFIPAVAATTSNPIGWSVAGSVSLAYDVSIAQGTFNNVVEGQSLSTAFTNARTETNRSFGLGGFDSTAYQVLNPVLSPVLTPIAQAMYGK